MAISRNNKPTTDLSEQEILNWSFDSVNKTLVFQPVALAVDGPNAGSLVFIKAGYNSTTGNYELLTAGSGTTTPTDTTNTFLLETGSNFLLETGDELLLEA